MKQQKFKFNLKDIEDTHRTLINLLEAIEGKYDNNQAFDYKINGFSWSMDKNSIEIIVLKISDKK